MIVIFQHITMIKNCRNILISCNKQWPSRPLKWRSSQFFLLWLFSNSSCSCTKFFHGFHMEIASATWSHQKWPKKNSTCLDLGLVCLHSMTTKEFQTTSWVFGQISLRNSTYQVYKFIQLIQSKWLWWWQDKIFVMSILTQDQQEGNIMVNFNHVDVLLPSLYPDR